MRAGYPYPIETLRHWYVTPIGGQSIDLKPGQIGLNKDALAGNTDLVPYQDRVSLSKLDGAGSLPLFAKKYFEVVPPWKGHQDSQIVFAIGSPYPYLLVEHIYLLLGSFHVF